MLIGFIIWTLICVVFIGIGVSAWRSREAVGFFTGVKPPVVKDVRRYNRLVALLWFAYAMILEALGIPFLFLEQNSAGFMLVILGVVACTIALVIAYTFIEKKAVHPLKGHSDPGGRYE